MRKARYSHDVKKGLVPRMSWSSHNLYNLIARSTVPLHSGQTNFKKTTLTMFQQRWRSKRFLRGYHGDWIPERRFKRWFLPNDLPRLQNLSLSGGASGAGLTGPGMRRMEPSGEERMPIASLFMRDVERRLDVVVHRCCFARSAREGRAHVIHGKVKLNGVKVTDPGTLLNPGDLISIEPSSVPMLSSDMAKQAAQRKAAKMATRGGSAKDIPPVENANEEVAEATAEESTAAGEEKEGDDVEEGGSGEVKTEDDGEATAKPTEKSKGTVKADEGSEERSSKLLKEEKQLPPGVYPFNLPPFASPFLFIPPYLETSFRTCSAVYIRHPTISPARRRDRLGESGTSQSFRTDLPSPYPAVGDIFSLAWEHYARDAPRIRSDVRRQRVEARVGRRGIESARHKDEWKKRTAVRRGWDKKIPVGGSSGGPRYPSAMMVGGSTIGKRPTGKGSTSGRFLEKGQAKGKGNAEARA